MTKKSKYLSFSGAPPKGYSQTTPFMTFYDDRYFSIQGYHKVDHFLLLDTDKMKIVGKYCQTSEFSKNVSFERAPFGSFWYEKEVPRGEIKKWVEEVVKQAHTIKHYSPIYNNFISSILDDSPYSEKMRNLNHHIALPYYGLESLHPMQRRRIRKCEGSGVSFEKVTTKKELELTYDFLSRCRSEQGLTINIEKEKLLRLFDEMPECYNAFQALNTAGEIMAASVTVKVTDDVIYNYLPGSLAQFASYSPMVFLLFNMAQFYRQHSFVTLDLGLSSIDEKEQTSLAVFKERMGAERTDKFTYFFE